MGVVNEQIPLLKVLPLRGHRARGANLPSPARLVHLVYTQSTGPKKVHLTNSGVFGNFARTVGDTPHEAVQSLQKEQRSHRHRGQPADAMSAQCTTEAIWTWRWVRRRAWRWAYRRRAHRRRRGAHRARGDADHRKSVRCESW